MKKKQSKGKHISHRKKSKTNSYSVFTVNRVIFITACLLLFVAVGYTSRRSITHSVEGASIVRPFYGQETISLPKTSGAVAFNIYYKQSSDKTFTNAVRNIPQTISAYTISYLKKGVTYQYRISALNAHGSEFWWSDILPLSNVVPM